MEEYDKNIDFFKNLETDFNQSNDELWDKIEQRIEQKNKIKTLNLSWLKYAVAASIILLVSVGAFMRFYTETVVSVAGEQISHSLPDGSKVELNAETEISYNPYWWSFKREIKLSGEAFFEVEKGKKFTVLSQEATTEVLGTSFNIYARHTDYHVFCKTGKVKVSSTKNDNHFLITANELAVIDNKSGKSKKIEANENDFLAWKSNMLNFKDEPLSKVFAELSRQYGIKITAENKQILSQKFSGYFAKPQKPEQTLEIICIQFNLEFEKISEKKYKIK